MTTLFAYTRPQRHKRRHTHRDPYHPAHPANTSGHQTRSTAIYLASSDANKHAASTTQEEIVARSAHTPFSHIQEQSSRVTADAEGKRRLSSAALVQMPWPQQTRLSYNSVLGSTGWLFPRSNASFLANHGCPSVLTQRSWEDVEQKPRAAELGVLGSFPATARFDLDEHPTGV